MIQWKHSKTVPESESFDFVMELVRKGQESYSHAVKDGMVTIEWGRDDEENIHKPADERQDKG